MTILLKQDGRLIEMNESDLRTILLFLRDPTDLPKFLDWFLRTFGTVTEKAAE